MATGSLEEFEAFWNQTGTAHDSRVPLIFAVEIPVIVLTVLVVALRFYARTVVKKTLGGDDWVMGLATVCLDGRYAMISEEDFCRNLENLADTLDRCSQSQKPHSIVLQQDTALEDTLGTLIGLEQYLEAG
jgi:hypothetical protein